MNQNEQAVTSTGSRLRYLLDPETGLFGVHALEDLSDSGRIDDFVGIHKFREAGRRSGHFQSPPILHSLLPQFVLVLLPLKGNFGYVSVKSKQISYF